MEFYYEEAPRKLPVTSQTEVLVLGSGPAGFAAAIAAARMGSDVLLVEQCGTVGGIATSGLMSHWTGTVDDSLYREVLKRAGEKNETIPGICIKGEPTHFIDPEQLKLLMLNMLAEEKIKLLLYTFVSDVILEGDIVKGVIVENKSGRSAILAQAVIDATGDGDIACKAGVPYKKGREEDRKMQPATLMFKVGGVDTEKAAFIGSFETTYDTPNGELQSLAKKHLPYPAGHILTYQSTLPGVVTLNMTNCVDIDGTKAEDLTRAELVCRSQISDIIHYLRRFVPGFQNCFLLSSASLIGVRETRHFQGEKQLTEDDIAAARQFNDWVVKGAHFNFDVHNLDGAGLDETGVQKQFTQTKGYTIPYGCLVPVKVNRLLLSGRNISGTHMAHSNFRAMPICFAIGRAGGVAAALAVKKKVLPREISAKEIQQYLV